MADSIPGDAASQADRLIQEGTGKTPLVPADLEASTQFGAMTPTAKVEYYARKLLSQFADERDRLLEDKNALTEECRLLRQSDRELVALKACLIRDRWETAIAIIAMALGGGLIGSDANKGALFAFGWALVVLAGVWQIGKTLWITVVDWFNKDIQPPAASVTPPSE